MTLKGAERIKSKIAAFCKKMESTDVVQVGFMAESRYDDGTPVAYIAACNEFGGKIEVPEHEKDIYRSMNEKTGEFNLNGKFVKQGKSNFVTTVTVPAHEIVIPPRPFFRNMIAAESPHWGSDMAKISKDKNYNMKASLKLMGEEIKRELVKSIVDFQDPANAPSTIAKKGFNDPLIGGGPTGGFMSNSVTSKVMGE